MNKQQVLLVRALIQRVDNLLEDGYRLQFCSYEQLYALLVHHNGNRIAIKVDRYKGVLEQFTNHIKVHEESVLQS